MIVLEERPNIIIIPSNVLRKLYKANINLTDRIDYSKARDVLSITDLAELVVLNSTKDALYDLCGTLYGNIEYIFSGMSTEQMAEMDKLVRPMADSEFNEEVVSKYSVEPLDDKVPYNTIVTTSNIIVTIDNSILNYFKDKKNHNTYVIDILKKMYGIASQQYVASTIIYNQYLELL